MSADDTLARIDAAVEDWERGRDAARWDPEQGAVEPVPRTPNPPRPVTFHDEPNRAALAHAMTLRSFANLLHRGPS